MSIQEHLNKIRNAIKGSEVRESIAKGIETAYDDASEKHNNANMEVRLARGTNPNLNTRLNNMDDTDRQNTERIDSNYNEVTERIDSNYNETTARLTQTEINKVDKNGSGQVSWANISQDARQQISGDKVAIVGDDSVITSNLTDNSVTPSKIDKKSIKPENTEFIRTSSNLFNKDDVTIGRVYSYDGNIADSSNYGFSNFELTEPGTVYSAYGVYSMVWFDGNKDFLSLEQRGGEGLTHGLFHAPEKARYRIAQVQPNHNTYNLDKIQINEGTELLDYEPNYLTMDKLKLNMEINPINARDTTFAQEGAEVADREMRSDLINTNKNLGVNSGFGDSLLVEIEPNHKYVVSKKEGGNRLNVLVLPEYPDTNSLPMESLYYYSKTSTSVAQEISVINDIGGKFLWVYTGDDTSNITVKTGVRIPQLEIEEGSVIKNHLSKNLLESLANINKVNYPYYFPPESIIGNYEAKEQEFGQMSLSELYDEYDQLVNENPDYITKKILGKDESGLYDIWELKLSPQQMDDSRVGKKIPKIIMTCGIHGSEDMGVLSLLNMVKAICNDWKNDGLLEYLRFNVEFVFIPLLVPWGYVNRSGRNVNNVNIQRNFEIGWENGQITDPDGQHYGGAYPYSEIETQYAKQMIDENQDAMYYADIHNNQGYVVDSTEYLFWWIIPENSPRIDDLRIANKYHIENMTRQFEKNYVQYPKNEGVTGWVSHGATNLGTPWDYTISLGIPSTVFEGFRRFAGDEEPYTNDSFKANLESFTNWILTVLKQFKETT